MLHIGLDLGRRHLEVCAVDEDGKVVDRRSATPDADGLRVLAAQFENEQLRAVIESMTGARWVHDTLEEAGWDVEVADAVRVKALAPLTAKTDRIDAGVLADLSRRDLVPAIWLPPPGVRADRELARFRLFLVKLRTAAKNRIHSVLTTWGIPVAVSDLFGTEGRRMLEALELAPRWRESVAVSLETIDHLDTQIAACHRRLVAAGRDNPDVGLLKTIPGVGDILGFTMACEIGDISRFPTPKHLVSYAGIAPRVHQSGEIDRRGPLHKHGPRWLRWAVIEATIWAAKHPAYRDRHERTIKRFGKGRGPKVARIDTARQLTTAIWWMLTRREGFAPRGSRSPSGR